MSWIDIGHIDDIPARGARVLKTQLGCIGLFRTGDDRVFAVTNTCPHKGGPLSEGIVHGNKVTCPLHNSVFDLETGAGTDGYAIETYPVRVEDGRVLIDGDTLSRRSAA
ncbi:nitrite reductase small subunit NirD [Psychromarinibacter sp. S121]|uniref:nitrite reductase small subunit NirD n=1 Tax=Psychromarinibacter sp. S121 TaxID=3415127 RepID=UPI003C7A5DFA